MRTCSKCHKQYSDGFEFCPYCGIQLLLSNQTICPKCKKIISTDFNFCPYCNQKLTDNERTKLDSRSGKEFFNKQQDIIPTNAEQKISKGEEYFRKGYAYEHGKGVAVDKNFALAMYEKAAEEGYLQAKDAINRLNRTKFTREPVVREQQNNRTSIADNQQTNLSNNTINNTLRSDFSKAQNSKLLFDQAVELKRKGQYEAALMLYKQAYNVFPDDPDVQSTMYAMAKLYLLIGDYEKACTLFQDGLTMKLAKDDDHTARFYQKYVMSKYTGGLSESDSDYVWFKRLTADYSIFIGLSHYMLENNGAELLSRYRNDFNNHMQSVAGKATATPSQGYIQMCYDYGWIRVIAIASESYNRCFDKIDFGHIQKRKQEFLDILNMINDFTPDEKKEETEERIYEETHFKDYKRELKKSGAFPNVPKIISRRQRANGLQNNEAYFARIKKEADLGNRKSQFELAICYEIGRCTTKDEKEAFFWCQKSAGKGYDLAQCRLANYYLRGFGTVCNKWRALEWLRKAAKQGNKSAIFQVENIEKKREEEENKSRQEGFKDDLRKLGYNV